MFHENIKHLAQQNTYFRKVIHTGSNAQLVLMSLKPGEEIGMETHPTTDQILFFVKGHVKAILEGQEENVGKHDVVFVPAGTKHNFVNIGNEDAKLYTLYAPPEHPDGTVQKTRVGNK
jgi:mannose-6-phosphate isomerase-like protein (cupin superfamily)